MLPGSFKVQVSDVVMAAVDAIACVRISWRA
jgi:hypothetical protein